MRLRSILVALSLLAPTAALAAPGIVTVSTGLRAGPGAGFPMVDRIPEGARVRVVGVRGLTVEVMPIEHQLKEAT